VPTEILTKDEHRVVPTPPLRAARTEDDEAVRVATRRQRECVGRLELNIALWILGTILLTTLWVVNQWRANGAFEHFGNEGNPGDWSPTLWALGVGIWGLIVGLMALRVYFRRPATETEVDGEVERLTVPVRATDAPTDAALRRLARVRLARIRRLKFHVAAWALGMIVLTPLWALIEWQDNGGFERFSNDSQPGEWEPWILYAGGVWALVIAILALQMYLGQPTTEAKIESDA
jgi:hypothetical protein